MAAKKNNTALNNAAKRGRPFEKGNPGGPGRGNGKDVLTKEALAVVRDAVSDEDIKAIMARMVKAAIAGNVKAAKLILEYKAGKPAQQVNLADADGGPITFGWMGKCPKPKK